MKTLTYIKRHIRGTNSYDDVLFYRGKIIHSFGVNIRLGEALSAAIVYGLQHGYTRLKVVNESNHLIKTYFINLSH